MSTVCTCAAPQVFFFFFGGGGGGGGGYHATCMLFQQIQIQYFVGIAAALLHWCILAEMAHPSPYRSSAASANLTIPYSVWSNSLFKSHCSQAGCYCIESETGIQGKD